MPTFSTPARFPFQRATPCLVVALALAAAPIRTAGAPEPPTAATGPKLAGVDEVVDGYLERGRIAGAVVVVAKDGVVVHRSARGRRSIEGDLPLLTSDPFRIASMTKPVTSVAAMILVERGLLALDQPAAQRLPELGAMQVALADGAMRPPVRPITLRNLLSHSSGITAPGLGGTPVDALYAAPGALDVSSLADFTRSLGKLPLAVDPGTRWIYSFSHDVVARMVEVAAGQPFDRFLATEIFEPLSMLETGYTLPRERVGDLPAVHLLGRDGSLTARPVEKRDLSARPPFVGGNGGLFSTADDYLRFAEMLRRGGERDGRRILSAASVAEMTRNQLAPELLPWGLLGHPETGHGYGFGVGVVLDPQVAGHPGGAGTYYWAGSLNTYFWVDPVEKVTGLVLLQFEPFRALPIEPQVRQAVYTALAGR